MTYKNFTLDVDADGIALVTWDMPGRSMNVFNAEVIDELGQIVEQVANGCGDQGRGRHLRQGNVLRRRRPHHAREPLAHVLGDREDQGRGRSAIAGCSRVAPAVAHLPAAGDLRQARVAAINGTAIGGALRAGARLPPPHRRRQREDPARSARGEGRPVPRRRRHAARAAHDAGGRCAADPASAATSSASIAPRPMKLIDEVVPADKLIETAKAWIKAGGKGVQPWDEDGFKLPGGPVYSQGGHDDLAAGERDLSPRDLRQLSGARARSCSASTRGCSCPSTRRLRVESRYFAKILRSNEAAAMIRSLFVSMQELNKGARRPASVPPTKLKKVAILGAGFMGAGIAYVTARAGIEVVLVDRDQATADKGKALSDKLISDQVKKGRAKPADTDALLARIKATARLRRDRRRRPRHRGGVRGPQGQGRSHRQGGGRARRRRDLRLQHLDAADHLACRDRPSARRASSASISSRRSRG